MLRPERLLGRNILLKLERGDVCSFSALALDQLDRSVSCLGWIADELMPPDELGMLPIERDRPQDTDW